MVDVIQAERQSFTIKLRDQDGDPFDLTGFSEITVCFVAGSTVVTKTQTGAEVSVVGSDELGVISTALTTTDSDSMPKTSQGNIEVQIDFGGGDVRKTQFFGAFKVSEKLC